MMSMLRRIVLCSALLSLHLVNALPQIHYLGSSASPFRSQKGESSISAEAITVTLASLLSIESSVPVRPDVSLQVSYRVFTAACTAVIASIRFGVLQVGQILKPDLFNRPSAVFSVALAGSDIGMAQKLVPVRLTLSLTSSQGLIVQILGVKRQLYKLREAQTSHKNLRVWQRLSLWT